MQSLTGFTIQFTPSLKMSLLAVIAIALFMRLGFWQLSRAHEKQQLLASQAALSLRAPQAWGTHSPLPIQYQKMRVKGHYLKPVLLLDNQHYQHQFGYDVLSALELANGQVVLVDRGWLIGSPSRLTFPAPVVPQGRQILSGYAYYPSEKNWVLGQILEKKRSNLLIVERVDTKLIGQFLHKTLVPFIIRQSPTENAGYVRDWAIVSMPPARHYGYAVQWFAIALVILILYIGLNVHRRV